MAAGTRGLAEELHARFDHVALAAPRLRDLLPLWLDVLGGEYLYGVDNVAVGWRLVRVAFAGAPAVELMEPLEGSTFFDSFFERSPRGGLHHVTLLVDDLPHAHEQVVAAGYRAVGVQLEHSQWQELFLHPSEAHGALVQLASRPESPIIPAERPSLADVLAGHGFGGTGIASR
jgi:methylmalonyl-CoA/ethylmalonyl-CoA epimerase